MYFSYFVFCECYTLNHWLCSSKIKLHTTFDEKLDAHKVALKQHEKTLTQIQQEVLQNGGSFLGETFRGSQT